MTPDQAADLAARILAAMHARGPYTPRMAEMVDADRERVASDLAGLRDCWNGGNLPEDCCERHLHRYADGLRLTAALYGVTPGVFTDPPLLSCANCGHPLGEHNLGDGLATCPGLS